MRRPLLQMLGPSNAEKVKDWQRLNLRGTPAFGALAGPPRLTRLSGLRLQTPAPIAGEAANEAMIKDLLLLTIFRGAMAFAAATDLFTMTLPTGLPWRSWPSSSF